MTDAETLIDDAFQPAEPPRAARPMRARRIALGRGRFLLKMLVAAGLVAASDFVLTAPAWQLGWGLGGLALVWLVGLILARPVVLRSGAARIALFASLVLALAMINDPGALALGLFLLAMAAATLLPRMARFGSSLHLALTILVGMMMAPARPVTDLVHVSRLPFPWLKGGLGALLRLVAMPLIGSAVFLALFADANPILGQILAAFDPAALIARLIGRIDMGRVIFWCVVTVPAWALLRPSRLLPLRLTQRADHPPRPATPAFRHSLLLSLVAFNGVFALQNGIDIAVLWPGEGMRLALPEGVTYAAYAHQGAYPLIITALLAALFVIATFRPGSNLAVDRTLVRLVLLWVGQNVVLVGSSALRLAHYVEAYSLTELRLAAFIWMGLVALGLVLIMVRIVGRRDTVWLVNANMAAAALTLIAASFLDLGEIAGNWNATHNRERGTAEAPLDLCYLQGLGASALPAYLALDDVPLSAEKRAHVDQQIHWLMVDLVRRQGDARAWTVRGARRLHAAYAKAAEKRGAATQIQYHCDGSTYP